MEELKLAKTLALKAGKRILEIYEDYDPSEVVMKENNDYTSPLTKADLEANEIIVEGLKKEFPNYGILTEEATDDKSRLNKEFAWIMDPLDGTKEFIKKNGEFTVNIALTKNDDVVMGVIYAPVIGELFYAVKGEGAYLEKNGEKTRIKVSEKEEFSSMTIMASKSHMNPNLIKLINELGFASKIQAGSSLKGCLVANGKADAYFRMGFQNEWDFAAMNAIVNEANGAMTDLEGNALKYNQENPLRKGFVVSNNKRHEEMVKAAKKWIDSTN